MFDHMTLSVSDFEKAKTFYDAALAPLGITFLVRLGDELTQGVAVGAFGQDTPRFWIAEDGPQTPPLHIAFQAKDHEAVDAFYNAAIAAGGLDNGAPGLRPHYHADYYGAFVRDPDGNNIEAVCHAVVD